MSEQAEDLLKFLRRLRTVREYTPEPVSQEDLEAILEVGRWSASGGNKQPTEVIVVRDSKVKQQFGEWGAKPAAGASAVFLIVAQDDSSPLDEGRLAERLCLGAAACGLGSTVATLKNEGPDNAKQLLGIPADRRARTVVTVGHTDIEARRGRPKSPQPRKPMAEFAHWDRF